MSNDTVTDPASNTIIPRSISLPMEVAQRLRLTIQQGEVRPGERLPPEHELCVVYGVSRPVIREAVSLLKSEGLIISQQGRGQFVNPEGSNVFRIQADFTDSDDLDQLFEFLLSVEVAATVLAAKYRTKKELETIRKHYLSLDRAIADVEDGVREDTAFHRAIANASHNAYFIAFSEFLESQVRRLIRTARLNTERNARPLIGEVQNEHRDIFNAIESQDLERAREASTVHLKNAASCLRLYQG